MVTHTAGRRSESAGAEMKSSCLLQPCATPNSWLSLYTHTHKKNTHLKFSTLTAERHSSCCCTQGWARCCCVWSLHVCCVRTQTPPPLAQSDTNQRQTPWQAVNWYLCAGQRIAYGLHAVTSMGKQLLDIGQMPDMLMNHTTRPLWSRNPATARHATGLRYSGHYFYEWIYLLVYHNHKRTSSVTISI